MDKKQQEQCRRELIESFKVFYSSLNVHLKADFAEKMKPFIDEINECVNFTDDVDILVRFEFVMPNEEVKHTRFQTIQDFVKNGITFPEGVQRFKCEVKSIMRKNEAVYETTPTHPFYKSETFVVKDNAKSVTSKLYLDSHEQGKGKMVVVDSERLRDMSNNRIRVGEELIAEL